MADHGEQAQAFSLVNYTLVPWREAQVCHGFVGREGGVSRGPFATLNLSYWAGDEAAAVDENWRRLRAALPSRATVARVSQVHGAAVLRVGRGWDGRNRKADGMVTAEEGVVLGVLSADCVPILLLDAKAGVAAALHAGWRGTLAGIAPAGVEAMLKLGARPERIRAALGPAIGPCCFEVSQRLAARFARQLPGSERHARCRCGKAYLDLRAVLRDGLLGMGLDPANIAAVGPCTGCANDRYFSRRAARGEATGLQLSFVGLVP